MNELILLSILVFHFFADFVLQTHDQAINKYKAGYALTMHVLTYSLTWLVCVFLMTGDIKAAVVFFLITFTAHWLTDAYTAPISKKFFEKEDYHNGFVIVGFDQVLHYIQLYLTFKLIL